MQCKDFVISLKSKLSPFPHNCTKCHGKEEYGFLIGNRDVNLFQFYCRKSLIIIQGGDVCVAVFILCTVHGPCYMVSISYVHEECIFSFCVF